MRFAFQKIKHLEAPSSRWLWSINEKKIEMAHNQVDSDWGSAPQMMAPPQHPAQPSHSKNSSGSSGRADPLQRTLFRLASAGHFQLNNISQSALKASKFGRFLLTVTHLTL
jgi:hypothetical protein